MTSWLRVAADRADRVPLLGPLGGPEGVERGDDFRQTGHGGKATCPCSRPPDRPRGHLTELRALWPAHRIAVPSGESRHVPPLCVKGGAALSHVCAAKTSFVAGGDRTMTACAITRDRPRDETTGVDGKRPGAESGGRPKRRRGTGSSRHPVRDHRGRDVRGPARARRRVLVPGALDAGRPRAVRRAAARRPAGGARHARCCRWPTGGCSSTGWSPAGTLLAALPDRARHR